MSGGGSDSGSGWKERAGEVVDVSKEAPLSAFESAFFHRDIKISLQVKIDALQT